MFQSFDSPASPDQGPPRLALLRARLAGLGLDGFLVPRADAHQGEYVAARDERLQWLTDHDSLHVLITDLEARLERQRRKESTTKRRA